MYYIFDICIILQVKPASAAIIENTKASKLMAARKVSGKSSRSFAPAPTRARPLGLPLFSDSK